jgi:LmbE family N-acetylglucosaminyl deacetylase
MSVTRRDLLVRGGTAAGTAVSSVALGGLSVPTEPQAKPPAGPNPLNVIICGGHPGDPEYGCGGTVARLTGLGHRVVLLYLNNGAWPPTPAATRIAEAAKACEILKAKPLYADQENGHAVVDNAHYEAFAKIIADEKPDAVLTQWPLDNHRDHRAIAMLAYDAWKGLNRGFALYYYEVSNGEDTQQFAPTHYVDISASEEIKRAACYAHASQTPDRYYALQDQVAAFRGIERGCQRAEAFLLQQRSPGDPLRMLLGA